MNDIDLDFEYVRKTNLLSELAKNPNKLLKIGVSLA